MDYLVGGSGTASRTLTGSFNMPINYVAMPRQEILSSITGSICRSLQGSAGGGRSSITGVR
ncbi:MAG: hypothetical protein GF417_06740 [Candidatus Latescibacteria bacterium]|nr:hypothetical protein [bacterium]MBD3424115.1 hypothetical protein [Candidatus Latescibacterota bacterium]